MDGQISPKGHCLASRGSAEGQICPSVPYTNPRFFFLHILVPTLELITILP